MVLSFILIQNRQYVAAAVSFAQSHSAKARLTSMLT
jgi:hypothetical protein